VKFYHFSYPKKLSSILRDGLQARRCTDENDLTNGEPVVWLTTKALATMPLKQRKEMLRRGLLCGPRCRNLPNATVCLSMTIPTTDKRLKHFCTWLKKHPQPDIDPDDLAIDPDYWFYQGDIAPGRLAVFKTFPKGLPYWEMSHVREMWLRGDQPVFDRQMEADLLAARIGPADYVKAPAATDTLK